MKERKSNRLKEYDYSSGGYYFVTICTKNKANFFGNIINDKLVSNKIGKAAEQCWLEIPQHNRNVIILDEYVIMPNHVHGILVIDVGNAYMRSLQKNIDRTKMLLSVVVQQYKSAVTRSINKMQNNNSFQWQKSFYDHIIRNEGSLNNIREYIVNNHLKWELDIENASRTGNINLKEYYEKIIKNN